MITIAKKKAKKANANHRHGIATLLILAGLFIGIGVGQAIDKTPVGTLIGLGVGFLGAFIYAAVKK